MDSAFNGTYQTKPFLINPAVTLIRKRRIAAMVHAVILYGIMQAAAVCRTPFVADDKCRSIQPA